LRDQGVIKNCLYDLDFEKLGFDITIIAEVIATYGTTKIYRVWPLTRTTMISGFVKIFVMKA